MQVNLDKPLLDNSNMTDFCQKIKYFARRFRENSREVGAFCRACIPSQNVFRASFVHKGHGD